MKKNSKSLNLQHNYGEGIVSTVVTLTVLELQALATLKDNLTVNIDRCEKYSVLKNEELKTHLCQVDKVINFLSKIVQDAPSINDVEYTLFHDDAEDLKIVGHIDLDK